MNKDSLFVYEEDGFCELKYTFKDLRKLERENKKLKEQYCERTDCGGRIGNSKKVEELIKENEKLNHYKLLYQKVKERNDKAIKFVEGYMREDYYEELDEYITHLTWNMTKEDLLDILSNNEE